MIPLSVPHVAGNEWKYVRECLDTEWVSSAGKFVDKFEDDICASMGAARAVACVNGTAALQVSLQLVGVVPGDEVIVPTVTFIAPVNAVRYIGAEPVLMDCDDYYNIDVDKTLEFIENETVFENGETRNKTTRRRISAIIPVHVFGNAVDLQRLLPACSDRNISVVEDASESVGTYYTSGGLNGRFTGTIGEIGCYSFNGNKIMTTGGGGMIVTDDAGFADRARYLTTQAKNDPVRYVHDEIGYNFRLTNIQAAMGVAQLETLPEFIAVKQRNYRRYKNSIDGITGLRLANVPAYAESNYWFYALQIDASRYGRGRDELMEHLRENNIQTRPMWQLNHLQKPFRHHQTYRIEKAPELLDKTLNIPCSTNLSEQSVDKVIECLKNE
jgi:aminotransferase in exopolysaccharide biosynthesis